MSTPQERRDRLERSIRERILVIDGAMGSLIQAYELAEADYRGERFASHPTDLKGNSDVLSLTRPDVIREIHERYLEAGADLVTTNSFTASSISQADYGLQDESYAITLASAKVAREACDAWTERDPSKPRYVAGSLGPLNRTLSISPDVNDPSARAVSFDEVREAYATQARALVEGGADVILVETIFDTLNVKAGAFRRDRGVLRRARRSA